MSGGMPGGMPTEMSKSDFLVKTREELHFVDRRFHIPSRSRSILETIQKADGEWPEGGATMTILDKLLEIEKFLWDNRHKSGEIIQPKVWEAIELSRQISGVPAETNRKNRKSMVVSVTVGYTGLVDCWVIKATQRNLSQAQRNPWVKLKSTTRANTVVEEKDKPTPLEVENRLEREDFVVLVDNNILNTETVDEPIEDEIMNKALANKVNELLVKKHLEDQPERTLEANVLSEDSVTKKPLAIQDNVIVPYATKAFVNKVIFRQESRFKIKIKQLEESLRAEFNQKLTDQKMDLSDITVGAEIKGVLKGFFITG